MGARLMRVMCAMRARIAITACALAALGSLALAGRAARADTFFVTVAGLGGEPDYEQRFRAIAGELDHELKGTGHQVYTLSGAQATRAQVSRTLREVAGLAKPEDDFVLILIGHGSFDGVEYKMNLPGPDMTAGEIAALCNRIRAKRQLVVDTTSASGGALPAFARRGRAVITATKSGTERNATVFARYWADALEDPTADVDKSDSISALEAFQYATAKTAEFYETQKRLATEHAIFEDTGHGAPVRTASPESDEGRFLASLTLVRFGAARKETLSAAKRSLLAQKEQLEQQIDRLKYQRAALPADQYKRELTEALLKLAKVQGALDQ